MPAMGACPNCGTFVKCSSPKNQAETRCPKCKKWVIFIDGVVKGVK